MVPNTEPNPQIPLDQIYGRRNYDLEIAELRHSIATLIATVQALSDKIDDSDKKVDELITAWMTAKGLTKFIRWAAGVVTAGSIMYAAFKGLPKL